MINVFDLQIGHFPLIAMFLEIMFERFNYYQSFHPVFVLKVAEMKTQNKPLPQSCFKIQWKFLLSQID